MNLAGDGRDRLTVTTSREAFDTSFFQGGENVSKFSPAANVFENCSDVIFYFCVVKNCLNPNLINNCLNPNLITKLQEVFDLFLSTHL